MNKEMAKGGENENSENKISDLGQDHFYLGQDHF